MPTAWLRFAYACELLLAVIAVFTMWSQVGGQGHLDLMPWYWKLGLGGALSGAIVALTDGLATRERAVNRRSVFWAVVIVGLVTAMASVTYYYHLNEPVDEDGSEEGTTAQVIWAAQCHG